MANHTLPPEPTQTVWDAILEFLSRGTRFIEFFAVLVGAYLLARALRWAYTKSQRSKPSSAQLLMTKTIMLTVMFAGLWIGIQVAFDADPGSMFATLGIVSLALGFGLQNTVANLAAGVSLSLDKPFDVGDRIQVGQTWGDVQNIGFRSTSIRTTAGERVVIPNAILDTQEVWNYSGQQGELRVEIPLQISYQSSIPLAEDVALRVARDTEHVLAFPGPKLVVRGLGADGIDMELRCWLSDPNEKATVVDRILRRVKERFDEAGVHIPFPQRTLTYLKDEEPPAPTPEHLIGAHINKPVIVALIRSPLASPQTPHHVAAFAKGADARIVFVHVRPLTSALHPEQGQMALNKCLEVARIEGVFASGRMEMGNLTDVVAQVVREEGAKLLVLVRSPSRGIGRGWGRSEQRELQASVQVPVQFIEHDTPPVEKAMRHWHDVWHAPSEPSAE
ncbi:MAG: mechanosensitive ion channel domain-containing protein [Thermoplasmatota archaeon]